MTVQFAKGVVLAILHISCASDDPLADVLPLDDDEADRRFAAGSHLEAKWVLGVRTSYIILEVY